MRKIDKDLPLNPFLVSGKVPVIRKTGTIKSTKLDGLPTGDEILISPDTYGITHDFYIDSSPSYKVYRNQTDELLDMSRVALLFICIIPNKLKWNQDLLAISTEDYRKLFNVSTVTITNAINELIDHMYISRYKRGYYWINPHKFFYGDRLKKYSKHLILQNEQ